MSLRYSPRRIYVASSWRNEQQPAVVAALLGEGHEVYDFRNPPGNAWNMHDPWWKRPGVAPPTFPTILGDGARREAFDLDMKGLCWADTVVLVLPSGKSAHLEAGFAAGARKLLIVLGSAVDEPELMYGMARGCVASVGELVDLLRRYDPVRLTFDPVAMPPVRYRHGVTGEVRTAKPGAIGGVLHLIDERGAGTLLVGSSASEWTRLDDGGAP